jgi:hypothetical protein
VERSIEGTPILLHRVSCKPLSIDELMFGERERERERGNACGGMIKFFNNFLSMLLPFYPGEMKTFLFLYLLRARDISSYLFRNFGMILINFLSLSLLEDEAEKIFRFFSYEN